MWSAMFLHFDHFIIFAKSGSVTGWSLSWFAAVPGLVIKHVLFFFFSFYGEFLPFHNQINMWKSNPQNSPWIMTEIISKPFLKMVQTQMIRCCSLSRLLFSLCLCSVLFWSCVFFYQGSDTYIVTQTKAEPTQ